MEFPRDILDRVDRVIEYHQASKHAVGVAGPSARPPDWANQPSSYRLFESHPKTALPTSLLDASAATLSLLHTGLEALPESLLHPPQNLKTLASWLYMAGGLTTKYRSPSGAIAWKRCWTSEADVYPCEIYVAAFAIEGLPAGLYHFNPREFSLRKLREGPETLSAMKRGRPDLEFLKTVPATVLVSTIFCRAAWRFARRAYRHALLDTGHLVQNLVTTASGLGIQNLARLRVHDSVMRELIGLGPETEFADAEAVQGMVVWADRATNPMGGPPIIPAPLPPIPRSRLASQIKSYGSILAVHEDCVAPGVGVREVRPPMTELSVLSRNFPVERQTPAEPPDGGAAVRRAVLAPAADDFQPQPITRDQLWNMNRLGFRGGSYFPIYPDGPHVGLIRPFWIIHSVTGMEAGIWYYRPQTDEWSPLNYGIFRADAGRLTMDNAPFANGAAVCIMVANLHRLLTFGGPDLYRLVFLEAGSIAQRMGLAAASMGLGYAFTGEFYDEAPRVLLGIDKTGWEPVNMVAVGTRIEHAPASSPATTTENSQQWKG